VRKILESGSFGQKMPPVPCVTPFLWLRANNIKKSKKSDTNAVCPQAVVDSEASPEQLLANLKEAHSVQQLHFFIM